jgi:predicted nucleotidyltransferase
MKTTKIYLELLQQYKNNYAADYGIKRMGIFGSVARGEHDIDSDIDIYVDADRLSLLRMGGLVYDLQELFEAPVDLVHNTGKLNPEFRKRIENEVIYV